VHRRESFAKHEAHFYPSSHCLACLGGIDKHGHPQRNCRDCHVDMQHMPHFRRKGEAQNLTAKDTTVYEQLVLEEDPDYATILKSRNLGGRSKRQDLFESDVALALNGNTKAIRYMR